ncbi:very-long-chain 3-oxoacyl-CoA reductase-like isoform X2 [Paramacrobiotus metropolitanus]|uniref:very-long-chain 3-oxoacyl-CoA reductase-like isoform X2 n=1 Tax=Paramacrobiotus metropolitanus TaxID=2943436 RepID=UPI0024458E00|nr:very-long-chain 3-oxoacyl-CoA reductase-like isoform X2 [Paramacrobiotus metropolitanus]
MAYLQEAGVKALRRLRGAGAALQWDASVKSLLAAVGAASLGYWVARGGWALLRGSVSYFLAGPLRLGINLAKLTRDDHGATGSGSGTGWAVVSGGNEGLGLAFAKELARRGVNVIVVGRNAEKLDMVAREIEAAFHVKADMLVMDFSRAGVEDYQRMRQRLARIRVDILVNALGMVDGVSGAFGSASNMEQTCLDMLHVNLMSMFMLTNAVLPGMKERRAGVIVNLSSLAAVYPLPHYALYGAIKACVDFFSLALHSECRHHGITVQSVLAGPVLTKLTRNFAKSFFIVPAAPFARDTLSQVGLRSRTFGHWIHALLVSLAQPIPLRLTLRFLRPRARPTTSGAGSAAGSL